MSIDANLRRLFSLEGKIIMMTGAAGGIGGSLSKGMAGIGAIMCNCDISEKGLKTLEDEIAAEGGKSKSFVMDVTNMDSIKSVVESIVKEYGTIDVLINVAGINKREGFMDVKEDTYDRIMDINLKSVFFITQTVVPHMMKKKNGSIINIGSHNATAMLGGCSVYGASKSGVLGLTRAMAVEWAEWGIRANAVSPGHVLTPLTQVTWDHPTRGDYLRDRIAMRRPGYPDEMVGIVALLASDSSSYISGANFVVDGGCLCGGAPWEFDSEYRNKEF
ncbi:MAG: SDR family oxidoreductase [Clostridiaceae bacterium]|jgi:NAD(P)-dependent dehydrogenase (short-subunit alcohol dehydrogenase family)|nr:SDR family oxidoreductase [Clostridiaceae bacterium]